MLFRSSRLLEKGPDRVSAFTIPKLMINSACGNVSIWFGLRGPNAAVATACASATNAMGDALKTIIYDDADLMITGGTEAAMTPMGLSGFSNMRALTTRNDDPTAASRPFDADRDGFVMGEGAAALVLESYEHAVARGAPLLAEVAGYSANNDAFHISAPAEGGAGAALCMRNTLADAAMTADQIGYINAHGTSTRLNDKSETQAVKTIFGDRAFQTPISSTKSMTGHLLGASGGIEAVMTAKAVETGNCPPTINLENPDKGCDLNYCANAAQHHDVKIAMSNNFGFGGHNVSLIMGKI